MESSKKIAGYRELNESEIAAMNEVKQKGAELGELVERMQLDAAFDQRWVSIGATDLQKGLMALTRAIAKPTFFVFALLLLAGCSSGLQEKAFKNEHNVFIVSQSFVNDRVTAEQPHITAEQACWKKHTSEEMVELRKDGEEHSWYYQCQDLKDYKPGQYTTSLNQPVATLYQGPISAAVLGASVGTGLALSGDTVTQQGGGASASAKAKAGKGRR